MRASARWGPISGKDLIESHMYACNNWLRKITLIGLVLAVGLALLVPSSAVMAQRNSDCLACHSDQSLTKTDGKSVYVDESVLKSTSHGRLQCTDCHHGLDITKTPHAAKIQPVLCVDCHSDAKAKHSSHKDMVPDSGSPAEISASCKKCHGSHMYKPLPTSCGECHPDVLKDYQESIHGKAAARGEKGAPVCVDCHGGCLPSSPLSPKSPVCPARVVDTCCACHGNAKLNKQYHLPGHRLETYRESYHGIANRYGDVTVANCASCHGAHLVLPSSDPKSSVNKKNLPKTCGKCHPGANANFAKGKIHVEVTRRGEPLLYYVNSGFKWLTICTMLALVGHIVLDLFAKYRRRRSGR